MGTIDSDTRAARRSTAIAIVAVVVSLAAIATLGTQSSTTGDEIFARIGDYLAQANEALTSQ